MSKAKEVDDTACFSEICEKEAAESDAKFCGKYDKSLNMPVLLILAGLFSTVNTSFITSQQQTVNQDPTEITHTLLKVMIHTVPCPSIALTVQAPSTELTNRVLHSLNIVEKIILSALVASLGVEGVGARAVSYKDKARTFLLPLSVLKVWTTVWDLHQTRHIWGNAENWITRNSRWSTKHSEVADRICQRLLISAWSGHLAGFTATDDPIASIAGYASNKWLNDRHIQQVQDILRHQLNLDASLQSRWIIEDVFFSQRVQEAYQVHEDGIPKSMARWLDRVGEELATGRKQTVIGVVHVGGNHWVAFAIDFPSRSISFGDPLGTKIPDGVIASFKWWTSRYHSEAFSTTQLQVTHQQDSVSCRILALNALQHLLSTKTRPYPLISSNPSSLSLSRLQHFDSVLQWHLSQYQRETDHFNPPNTRSSTWSHNTGNDEDGIECIGIQMPSPTSRAKWTRGQHSVVIEIRDSPSASPSRSSSAPPSEPPISSSPQGHLVSHESNT
ncbi:hypothetical protein M407DRAFT_22294 [Tulasnella calospora MUT 4182]|uniref:Ubiquitin-like protease family profile domain-containing protein n=1 Tax=Tulasnella calospora MUT 4182 TaxID=1051891 RepID=A0A0C3QLN7_9AGAM|nr:hypothetical protein M407DRAFT_22294 [Tulasnella calospora MUT 4182]